MFNYHTFRELQKRAAGVAGFRQVGANLACGKQTVSSSVMLVNWQLIFLSKGHSGLDSGRVTKRNHGRSRRNHHDK
jgi:hypothetical protein